MRCAVCFCYLSTLFRERESSAEGLHRNKDINTFQGTQCKQNERESFSLSKIEKYNRYKDKIIFRLEFNV